jgi:hypothetical protein
VRDLAEVAERLRLVRQARRKFLRLWAIDQTLVEPLLDRVVADVLSTDSAANVHGKPPRADKG